MVLAVAAGLVLSGPGLARAELANTTWPMRQHDAHHSGQSQVLGPLFPGMTTPPADAVQYWQGFDRIRMSPVIGKNGTIYVGLGFAFCAINPATATTPMTTKWCTGLRADVSGTAAAVANVPLPSGAPREVIYVGDRDNTLTAFGADGTVLFRYNHGFEGDIWTDPVVDTDGTVYFAFAQNLDGLGVLVALEPKLDDPINYPNKYNIKWKKAAGQTIIGSSPALDADKVYVGVTNGKFQAYYKYATVHGPAGTMAFNQQMPSARVTAAPVIDPTNGTLYVGHYSGIAAVHPIDGHIMWNFPAHFVDQTPALAPDGTLYAVTKYGKTKTLYAIDTHASPSVLNAGQGVKWTFSVNAEPDMGASPLIALDGVVYVGLNNKVWAIGPPTTGTTGNVLWSYATGNYIISAPAIGGPGGTAILYIGSADFKLYAIKSDRVPVGPNDPPVAVIDGCPPNPAACSRSTSTGHVETFGSASTDPNGDPLSASWNFGDGNTATGSPVTHAYAQPNTYIVTLTVSDARGGVSHDTMEVDVTGVPVQGYDDDFHDPGTLAAKWDVFAGNLMISNGELRTAAATGYPMGIVKLLTGPNQTASADFASVSNNSSPRFGIVLCHRDPQNYYVLYRLAGGASQLRISRVVNGVETLLKYTPTAQPVVNALFTLEGSVSGTTLKLKLGAVELSVSDPTISCAGSRLGILMGSSQAFSYRADNFHGVVSP